MTSEDASGAQVPGATYSLTDAFGNTVSGNAGSYNNLSAGQYTLNVSAPGYQTSTQSVTISDGETAGQLSVQLAPTATAYAVNVRVLNGSTNADLAGATVVAFDSTGKVVATAVTQSGTASLQLVNGTYTLKVLNDGDIVSASQVTVSGQAVTVPVVVLNAY